MFYNLDCYMNLPINIFQNKSNFFVFIFSKQVRSKDQEMGEMEFKAHGPIYGDDKIRVGGRGRE